MLTKAKLFAEFDLLKTTIKKDNSKNPLILLYYCGHGVSENLAWNQFLIPGNYTEIVSTKKIDNLYKNMIYVGDITDHLDKSGYRYILLVDCCRKENSDNSFPEKRLQYFINNQNTETIKLLWKLLKY